MSAESQERRHRRRYADRQRGTSERQKVTMTRYEKRRKARKSEQRMRQRTGMEAMDVWAMEAAEYLQLSYDSAANIRHL